MTPTLIEEMRLRSVGLLPAAGLDEAGRGSWAGPVVAAAVVLPIDRLAAAEVALEGVDDSKRLSPVRREELALQIFDVALGVGMGVVSPALVDSMGIVPATRLAMRQALGRLSLPPRALLIDALPLPSVPLPQRCLKHGDARVLSIAAASIVAKVHRDRLMVEWAERYPAYGFERHKGYGTPQHFVALVQHGPSPLHRRSYAPLRHYLQNGRWRADRLR